MEKQIDFNGEWSNEYDDIAHKIIPAYHTIYALTQHLLRDRLNKKARISVAGAGTGKEMIDCSHNNPHWLFTAFDPAESMLSIAQQGTWGSHLNQGTCGHGGRVDMGVAS